MPDVQFPETEISPARFAFPITPGPGDLASWPRALWIGGAGDITVVPADGVVASPVTFTAVPAGTLLPLRVQRVTAATATNIVGLL
jgi:hypothetical protein